MTLTNIIPVTTAPADRAAWLRPVLEVLSADKTAFGGTTGDDGYAPNP
ncbi:hypothetical protein V6768_11415 [Tistrella mobilis]